MKNLIALVAFGALFNSAAFSQTKKIAHRSHSGKNTTFKIDGEDNFGLPSNSGNKTAKDTGAKKTTPVKPDSAIKPGNKKAYSKSKKAATTSGTDK